MFDYCKYFLICATCLFTLNLCAAHEILDEGGDLKLERQALLNVAQGLEKSLNELRRLEKAKAAQSGVVESQLAQPPKGGAMAQIVTIQDWEGPLEALLQAIAEQYHYQLNIIGKKPALPILVSISAVGKTLGTVIQDADLQAGKRAHVSLDDTTPQSIQLRYVAETV